MSQEDIARLNEQRRKQTHCKRGHEFTKDNTYRYFNGSYEVRECRACRRLRQGSDYRPRYSWRTLLRPKRVPFEIRYPASSVDRPSPR